MRVINEEDFRKAMKTLVLDEPEKLEFFGPLGADIDIPPFVPAEAGERKSQGAARRRGYTFGMGAAAACFVLFLSITMIGFSQGGPESLFSFRSGGGGAAYDRAPEAAYSEAPNESADLDLEAREDSGAKEDGAAQTGDKPPSAPNESVSQDNGAMEDDTVSAEESPPGATNESVSPDTGAMEGEATPVVEKPPGAPDESVSPNPDTGAMEDDTAQAGEKPPGAPDESVNPEAAGDETPMGAEPPAPADAEPPAPMDAGPPPEAPPAPAPDLAMDVPTMGLAPNDHSPTNPGFTPSGSGSGPGFPPVLAPVLALACAALFVLFLIKRKKLR